MPTDADPTRALYAISVAAQLTGLHPQSIRSYEDHGLVVPARTDGGTRRYSDHDITRLNRISGLLGDGLNLAGIDAVLALEATNQALRAEIAQLRARAAQSNARAQPAARPDRPPPRSRPSAAPSSDSDE